MKHCVLGTFCPPSGRLLDGGKSDRKSGTVSALVVQIPIYLVCVQVQVIIVDGMIYKHHLLSQPDILYIVN